MHRLTWRSLAIGKSVGVGLLGSCLLMGCGGSDPVEAPQAAENAPRGLNRGGSKPKRSKPKPTAKRQSSKKTANQSPAAAADPDDPSESFYIAGAGASFDIVGHVRREEELAMEFPEPGLDSTTYVVLDEPAITPPGSPISGFELPDGFTVVTQAGHSTRGLPLRIACEADGSLMALIPAGVSVLGSNSGSANAAPELSVYLDSFYIDVTEVTLGSYQTFLDSLPGNRKGQIPLNASDPEDHPVLGLTWNGATAFAKWAGKDLPSEVEWEKAARAEAGFDHPWGNQRAIWERLRVPDQIDAVRSFRTDLSVYGVFDLAGNAREWCSDFYSELGHADAAATAGSSTLRDWNGVRRPSSAGLRVVKGNGPDWKAWHRSGVNERDHVADLGFRCVLHVAARDSTDP